MDEIENLTTTSEQAAKLSAEVAMPPTKLSKLSKSQGETNELQDKSDENDGLTTQSEQAAELSAEVAKLLAKLSKLSESQAETNKLQGKSDENDGLTTQLEQAAKLSAEVAMLLTKLSTLSKSQAETNKLQDKSDENEGWANQLEQAMATYLEAQAASEEGLKGIRLALRVLEEYYAKGSAHGSSEGSAGGTISLSTNLTAIASEKETADEQYDEVIQGNRIGKASLATRVEELTGSLSTNEADLKVATEVRTKELADFDARGAQKADAIEDLATELEQATAKSGHRGRAI